ncbi:hypothetical protein ABZX40_38475 [Streptomyces sp. NPDC004610]
MERRRAVQSSSAAGRPPLTRARSGVRSSALPRQGCSSWWRGW